MKTIKQLMKELGKINEELIKVDKESDDHIALLMTHSGICAEIRAKEEVLDLIEFECRDYIASNYEENTLRRLEGKIKGSDKTGGKDEK